MLPPPGRQGSAARATLQVTKVDGRRLMLCFFCRSRTAHETSETFAEREEQPAGREETQDGLQRRTTGQAEA